MVAPGVRWGALTTRELDAVDRVTPVLLSIAAIEQHGPHLPLATDATIGQAFLARVEERHGPEVLILPQIAVGCSEHHMDFAGSLSVRHQTLVDYAGDVIRSVLRHGFRNVVILNSHGGNQGAGQVLLEEVGAADPACRIALLTWWRLAAPELSGIRDSAPGGCNHACEFETSLMLHAASSAVRREAIGHRSGAGDPAPVWAREDMLTGSRGTLYRSMREKSGGDGVVGEPALATAEKGRAIEDAVTDALSDVIRSLRDAG